jgi:hypothetical protein
MTRSRNPGPCATARAWPPHTGGGIETDTSTHSGMNACHLAVFHRFAHRLGHLLSRMRTADAPA